MENNYFTPYYDYLTFEDVKGLQFKGMLKEYGLPETIASLLFYLVDYRVGSDNEYEGLIKQTRRTLVHRKTLSLEIQKPSVDDEFILDKA